MGIPDAVTLREILSTIKRNTPPPSIEAGMR